MTVPGCWWTTVTTTIADKIASCRFIAYCVHEVYYQMSVLNLEPTKVKHRGPDWWSFMKFAFKQERHGNL